MKKISALVALLILATLQGASAEARLDAKTWNGLKTYDVQALSQNFAGHVGELVAVKFNFRGKDIRHMKPNWYEGSIWQPSPNGKSGFVNVRIMVSKQDMPAFKSLTMDSTSSEEMTVYGNVLRDADANFIFVRLLGRNKMVDSSGNAVVSW